MFREIGVLELDQQPNLMFLFEIFQQLRRFLGFPLESCAESRSTVSLSDLRIASG